MTTKLFSLIMVIFSQCMCQNINLCPLNINNFYVKDISMKLLKSKQVITAGRYGHEM